MEEGGRWEHFPHEADMGIRGLARTREGAFEQAALALTAVVTDPGGVLSGGEVDVRCESPDTEVLLVDWLNRIIYEMATRDMLFGRFEVSISGPVLTGRLWGERVDRARHQPAVEIKGATYTALRVEERNGQWMAQCVVDV